MLTAGGHVKLIDFGTCKDLVETDLNGGEFVGTAQYMSPQAVASDEQVGNVDGICEQTRNKCRGSSCFCAAWSPLFVWGRVSWRFGFEALRKSGLTTIKDRRRPAVVSTLLLSMQGVVL